MSCIAKLLELKGDKEFIKINSHVVIESGGKYKGHDYCVVFNNRGIRCGYVEVTKNSKYHNEDFDIFNFDEFCVHGGVTAYMPAQDMIDEDVMKTNCGDIWIGFDAAHVGDGRDNKLLKKYFNEAIIGSLDHLFNDFMSSMDVCRSKNYMESECKSLIDQIVSGESNE